MHLFKKINSILILLMLVFLGCSKNNYKPINGNFYMCRDNGSYREFLFDKNYLLMLDSEINNVFVYKINYSDSLLFIEKPLNSDAILFSDKKFIYNSVKDEVYLKNFFTHKISKLKKGNFNIQIIDSTNLDNWKENTLKEFKLRANTIACKVNISDTVHNLNFSTESIDTEKLIEE